MFLHWYYTGNHPGWNATIYSQMTNWEAMVTHLLINNTRHHSVLLVRYEDLKSNTLHEVQRMLKFLQVPMNSVHSSELAQLEAFHKFHRNTSYTFDHYTHEQKMFVNSVIAHVAKQLQAHGIHSLNVEKYIRS